MTQINERWIKIASLLLLVLIGVSLLPVIALAQTNRYEVSMSSSMTNNQQVVVSEWVNRLRETIRTTTMLNEQDRERLMEQLNQALQIANKGDIQGAIYQILNVTKQLTIRINEQSRERVRIILEEKTRYLNQIRDTLPPEIKELVVNASTVMNDIEKGRINPPEISKIAKKISVAKREIERNNKTGWEIINKTIVDEETKNYVKNLTDVYIVTGLTALLMPAEKIIENVKFMIQKMDGSQDLLNASILLEESINLIKQALKQFGNGSFSDFKVTLAYAKEKLEQAKMLIAKPTNRKMGMIGPYNMLLTASRMIDSTIKNIEKVMGGVLEQNKSMVKGTIISFNDKTGELTILGSLHIVVKSPDNRLRSAGFIPIIGTWTVIVDNNTKVIGDISESSIALVLGSTLVKDGKIVVIAEEVYVNDIKKLREIENEVEETIVEAIVMGNNA